MKRDDIIRMAFEASGGMLSYDAEGRWTLNEQEVIRLAALVAAEKDEEIARLQGEINRMHRDLATIIKGVMRGQPQ